jgi:TPR repeat protein
MMYEFGTGGARDLVAAGMWYQLGAAQGYARAADQQAELWPRLTAAQRDQATAEAEQWAVEHAAILPTYASVDVSR